MPMVIIPEYQGKGIGYRVIMTLLNRAKLQGIKHIKLSGIYTFNEKSFNLYSKCGFIETNRDENKIYMEIKL
jgi:GNAT superfamily N-acetyltransferase